MACEEAEAMAIAPAWVSAYAPVGPIWQRLVSDMGASDLQPPTPVRRPHGLPSPSPILPVLDRSKTVLPHRRAFALNTPPAEAARPRTAEPKRRDRRFREESRSGCAARPDSRPF